jgi:epoxyqueuosine reductase
MDSELTGQLRAEAARLGFVLAGCCPAVAPPGLDRFHAWLEAGLAGEMDYLSDRRDAYAHPSGVLDGAKSVMMLAFPYRTSEPRIPSAGQGRVSRYAWGNDYHDLLRSRANDLVELIEREAPSARSRAVVDTAPLLEREFGELCGLGWVGKNTLLLNRDHGSWFFLAALITTVELVYDGGRETDHCGTCRACLDACPTQAFPAPYVLDSRRCISYLTIELSRPIPRELRPLVGDWLFGCDVCQDVCPWNRRAPATSEPGLQPAEDLNPADLCGLFLLEDDGFRRRFRPTPLWRPKRRGLLRNAAIVLGNQRRPSAVPALIHGLCDSEPLVRGACAWALGQIGTARSVAALTARREVEEDREVLDEIELAMNGGRDE